MIELELKISEKDLIRRLLSVYDVSTLTERGIIPDNCVIRDISPITSGMCGIRIVCIPQKKGDIPPCGKVGPKA